MAHTALVSPATLEFQLRSVQLGGGKVVRAHVEEGDDREPLAVRVQQNTAVQVWGQLVQQVSVSHLLAQAPAR